MFILCICLYLLAGIQICWKRLGSIRLVLKHLNTFVMEAAKAKRTTTKAQFTRYEKRLKTVMDQPEADTWTVNTRYEDLKVRWEKLQEAHDEYVSHLVDTDTVESTVAEQWLDEIIERFDDIEVKVGQKLKGLKSETQGQALPNTVSENMSRTASGKGVVKIERMKFQVFDGDIKKYPEFKEEFVKHVQPQCDDRDQAFMLKSYLSESVRSEVSHVSDDYKKMWDRLDQKYGNTGKLVDAILADVKSISLRDATNGNVLQMINTVEKANRDLERLGEHAELRNSTSISIVEQAMTKDMRHEWVKLIASKSCTSSQKFNSLIDFLGDWRNRLEYMGASIRDASDDITPSGATYHAGQGARQNQVKYRCWLHKHLVGDAGDHPVWRCRDFLEKSREERRELVVAHKACMCCLLQECVGTQDPAKCVRKFTCMACQGLHNSRLHIPAGVSCHVNDSGNQASNAILPTQTL